MIGIVKLNGFEQRKPHQLSGGQRQRVALARSLIKRPKLLLLDEPLGALDKKLREHTQFELVNIQERLGVTFVVVTHDQEEAMTLASRIGVMNQGRIVQVGTPHEIYEFPGHALRRGVHRQREHVRGPHRRGRAGSRRRSNRRARLRRSTSATASARRPMRSCGRRCGRRRCSSAREAAAGGSTIARRRRSRKSPTWATCPSTSCSSDSGKTVRVTQPNTFRQAEDRFTWEERVWVSWHESSAVVVTRIRSRHGPAELRHSRRAFEQQLEQLLRSVTRSPPYRWSNGMLRSRSHRAHARHRGAVALAAAVLPDPLRHRPEDQLRRDAARRAAVHAAVPVGGAASTCSCGSTPANYLFLLQRFAVSRGLPQLAEGRLHLDDLLPRCSAIRWRTASRARRQPGGTSCCC